MPSNTVTKFRDENPLGRMRKSYFQSVHVDPDFVAWHHKRWHSPKMKKVPNGKNVNAQYENNKLRNRVLQTFNLKKECRDVMRNAPESSICRPSAECNIRLLPQHYHMFPWHLIVAADHKTIQIFSWQERYYSYYEVLHSVLQNPINVINIENLAIVQCAKNINYLMKYSFLRDMLKFEFTEILRFTSAPKLEKRINQMLSMLFASVITQLILSYLPFEGIFESKNFVLDIASWTYICKKTESHQKITPVTINVSTFA